MDTALPNTVIQQRNRKKVYLVVDVLLVLSICIWLVRFSFASTISRSAFTTSTVEVGSIENTLTASGQILPEFEEVITSPISASIQNVLLDAGSAVKAGQAILTLDKTATQTEYEKQKFQLESKRNSIQQLKVELDKSFYDIKSNNDIKQLRINSLKAAVEDAKRLYKAGGGTKEDVERAELDLKVAELEKKQLENEIKAKQKTMQLEIRESEIAAAIQENDLNALGRKLQMADIVANHAGVITWVNKNIGVSIQEGESLARVADLSSFKANGTISDTYLDQLHNGMPVIIRANDMEVRGIISTIYPSVQNGIVSFDIQLNDRNNKQLRPDMKVDVYVVTAANNHTMRVANGAAFKGAPMQDIFVLKGDKAERRTVHIGMSNFDYVEIKDNVQPGDVVITSDMSDYKNAKEITIKK
ncbi:HlyD family efflux transporter periplasmic adaptor subunit [Ilyomonas limi]|uniref:HlyD family efflux transporter periplasmic adaptor subunit n=2 Tax=Ilyomonas limi TaxID=2575867 RepID=A0A4U3KYR4_9BACT|nr:HlyD family efflux transporter periplasmic adaptor subunit [Ilyomonas limi]